MRRLAVAALVVVAVLAATLAVIRALDEPPGPSGLQAAADPFGRERTLPPGARRAVYSPDGARLAVVADGLLRLENGELSRITEPGTRVVDAAWFPAGTAVVVAEGPAATGELPVLEHDGTPRGRVALEPVVGFGPGHGLVALSNEEAVVTVVDRPGLGTTEARSLALVDLRSGAVRRLPPPGGEEEWGPHRVDENRVLYTAVRADGTTVPRVLDVRSGDRRRAGPVGTQAAGVVAGGLAVLLDGRSIVAVPVEDADGERQRLGRTPPGSAVVAVHPAGTQAVVTASTVAADGTRLTRLRRLGLTAPRIRTEAAAPGYGDGP